MLDDMLRYTETLRERPVWQVIPDEVRGPFRGGLPAEGTPLAEVHAEFLREILPFAVGNAHPGFMGWVQGGGTPVGMLAEMLAAGLNANVGGRDQVPLEVERQVTEWMRGVFGFPAGASGVFVTGTSVANFLAVVVARDACLGNARRQGVRGPTLTAYASEAAHGCLARALDLAGLGSEALRLVAMDERHRVRVDALEAAIAADRAAGCMPFLVIGTAGTVDTGAIDDLAALSEVCAREGLWFHVDGAFGALAALVPELRPRLVGIERADSLAFDFHKWGQVPYDAGFLLVRVGQVHREAFASESAYLQREDRGMSAGSPWPCDLGVDLSRGFRALKTWMTFKVHGADTIGGVIRQTCELARYLSGRIESLPELEVVASVELNIVCFRYCFGVVGEEADRLHRQMAIELQEGGLVAPSTTVVGGRVCLRAAFVNHRTRPEDVDTLVEAVLACGRALAPKAWQPAVERTARLQQLDGLLATEMAADEEVGLRVERAAVLAEAGRVLEARSDHFRVLVLAPEHLPNLLGLGRLLVWTGQYKAAKVVYAEAVRLYPDSLVSRVNLGGVLLETADAPGARTQYEAALAIDPEFPQAHGGMYYALTKLGEAAEQHRSKAFGQKNIFVSPYHGEAAPIPILLLVASVGGNTPIEKLLNDRIFQTFVVVVDFCDPKTPLPEHQLIVNGIGDADKAGEALATAALLVRRLHAPVLNGPEAVLATGRCGNAERLGALEGVVAARTAMFAYEALASERGGAVLAEQGFCWPLLLRVPGLHMGEHFVRVEEPAALAAGLEEMPGREGGLLVIEYLDARGVDGCFRKYRVMMIGGRLYPLHLAISERWKVHYFSADMAERPEHRAEEAQFLVDMEGVLGAKAVAALERIDKALGLDYAGIDFGLSAEGELLLFEANATMVVEQPAEDERWDYRRAAVGRIHAAVGEMLRSRCRVLAG
jgi:aromatic-L-amino-acid decarboxylase